MDWDTAIESLKSGGVGVIPTDTLYGLVGSALIPEAVERIYAIKGRDKNKPLIILLNSLDDLAKFGAELSDHALKFLKKNWPAPLSVVLSIQSDKFGYLYPLNRTLAFRMPDDSDLQSLLCVTGPLVAPSANPQGKKPAATIEEAEGYFGVSVDFYVDGGIIDSEPSTIVDMTVGKIKVIREGSAQLKNIDDI